MARLSSDSSSDSISFSSMRWWLLAGLSMGVLAISGCAGSQLGESVGKSLEPDPQLAENGEEVVTRDNNTADEKTPTPEKEPVEKDEAAADEADEPAEPKVVAGEYTDLGKAPEEIQPYLIDLIELELLVVRSPTATPAPSSSAEGEDAEGGDAEGEDQKASEDASQPVPAAADVPGPDEFRPNQAITRREYARWLLATNNQFYKSQRTRKIRPGVKSSRPVFNDVSVNDPDFAAIQGLAEAGIIPSPLTGSSTTLTFRPDAPLTRKDMLLWKVPLDTRQPLPQATASAVEQAWGFQDASKIEPRALQAVLADHQNGDFANIRRAFNYTTLFQPDKAATRAEAAAVLWRFGNSTEGITAAELRKSADGEQAEEDTQTSSPSLEVQT